MRGSFSWSSDPLDQMKTASSMLAVSIFSGAVSYMSSRALLKKPEMGFLRS